MANISYGELVGKFYEFYGQAAYVDALALVEETLADFPEHRTEMITWKICVQSRLGESEKAIETLRAAIETSTYWYLPAVLRGESDLALLQDNPEFQRLVALCEARREKASQAGPRRLEFAPKTDAGQKLPLLIAFHGWGQNAEVDAPHWQGLADQGWLVAVTCSSYQVADGMYTWDNLERAIDEAKAHYEALCRDFPVDPKRVVLGGFSQGGGVAIWSALTRSIPVCGVVGVGPALNGIDALAATLPARPIPDVRVYMVSGAEENDRERFAKLGTLFVEKSVPFHHETVPGIGHEFPLDFEPFLERALKFILE